MPPPTPASSPARIARGAPRCSISPVVAPCCAGPACTSTGRWRWDWPGRSPATTSSCSRSAAPPSACRLRSTSCRRPTAASPSSPRPVATESCGSSRHTSAHSKPTWRELPSDPSIVIERADGELLGVWQDVAAAGFGVDEGEPRRASDAFAKAAAVVDERRVPARPRPSRRSPARLRQRHDPRRAGHPRGDDDTAVRARTRRPGCPRSPIGCGWRPRPAATSSRPPPSRRIHRSATSPAPGSVRSTRRSRWPGNLGRAEVVDAERRPSAGPWAARRRR